MRLKVNDFCVNISCWCNLLRLKKEHQSQVDTSIHSHKEPSINYVRWMPHILNKFFIHFCVRRRGPEIVVSRVRTLWMVALAIIDTNHNTLSTFRLSVPRTTNTTPLHKMPNWESIQSKVIATRIYTLQKMLTPTDLEKFRS